MSKSNLVPIVDPMYETYANNVAPKGVVIDGHQTLEEIEKYGIKERIQFTRQQYKSFWKTFITDFFASRAISAFDFKYVPASRFTVTWNFIKGVIRSFMYTPATTKHVKENKQRLFCNEKQLDQVTSGQLELENAACVLKYDQLEKVERTVLQKMLDASRPTK